MQNYNARVEIDVRVPSKAGEVDDLVDPLLEELAEYGVAAGRTQHGRLELVLTLPAESLRQATTTALALLAATGHPEPLVVEVMPTGEFDKRVDEITVPPLVSVQQTAAMLGVSAQRVRQLISEHKLAAVPVGDAGYAVPLSAAEARASERSAVGRADAELREAATALTRAAMREGAAASETAKAMREGAAALRRGRKGDA